MAEAEQRDVATLAAVARGGLPLIKTVERWETGADGQEVLVERQVTRTDSPPDVRALTWRLERRNPERWARRSETEDDEGGGATDEFGDDPVAEAMLALEDAARRQAEGMAALEAQGLGDIVDAEIVDERPPTDDG